MSNILKKALKRLSTKPHDAAGLLYPPNAGPEVPPELSAGPWTNSNSTNGSLVGAQSAAFEGERPEDEENLGEPITLAIIGAGQRGKVSTRNFFC